MAREDPSRPPGILDTFWTPSWPAGINHHTQQDMDPGLYHGGPVVQGNKNQIQILRSLDPDHGGTNPDLGLDPHHAV